MESFEFIHPGYCDNCWDEISQCDWDNENEEDDPNWSGEYEEDEEYPHGSLDY
jgi:hypothetical protein